MTTDFTGTPSLRIARSGVASSLTPDEEPELSNSPRFRAVSRPAIAAKNMRPFLNLDSIALLNGLIVRPWLGYRLPSRVALVRCDRRSGKVPVGAWGRQKG